MSIDRRALLKAGAAVSAAAAMSNIAWADVRFDPRPSTWRRFEVVTRVETRQSDGQERRRGFLCPPSTSQNGSGRSATTGGATAKSALVGDPQYDAAMLHIEWRNGEQSPVVEVTSRIAARDRATDFVKLGRPVALSPAERRTQLAGHRIRPGRRHRQADL